jgi:hypothetical protein
LETENGAEFGGADGKATPCQRHEYQDLECPVWHKRLLQMLVFWMRPAKSVSVPGSERGLGSSRNGEILHQELLVNGYTVIAMHC